MAYDELDLYGADDALDLSSGEDYVGASTMFRPSPGMFRAPTRINPGLVNPGLARAAAAGMKLQRQVASGQKLRRLAMAGMIPQIPLGIRNNSVAGGATVTISPEPGVPLRVTNFTVSPTIAGLFLITQITVARVNMLAGADAVPATLFTPESRHPPFENPILAAGAQIVVGVENIDAAAHPFFGAFQGVDLTPPYARMV